jgi:hypothetical protein
MFRKCSQLPSHNVHNMRKNAQKKVDNHKKGTGNPAPS